MFPFPGFQEDRCAYRDGTEKGYRYEFAPRQNSIHVVHVYGEQLDVRPFFGEVVKPTLEFPHFSVDRSTSFREDYQGVCISDFTEHQFHWALMDFDLFAIDQYGVKRSCQKPSERALSPIILSRDRTCESSEFGWECSPKDDRIKVTSVVCEINPLACFWFGTNPSNGKTTDQLCNQRQCLASQSAPRRRRIVRKYALAGKVGKCSHRPTVKGQRKPLSQQKLRRSVPTEKQTLSNFGNYDQKAS